MDRQRVRADFLIALSAVSSSTNLDENVTNGLSGPG